MNNKKLAMNLVLSGLVLSQNIAIAQPAKPNRPIDTTVVSVSELSDVKGDEWAYKAVKELVEKYDVLEGYPDSTYRGKKFSTRFELAQAVYDLATWLGEEIAMDREDLKKLAQLVDELSNELKALQGRVDKLETTAKDHETRIVALEGKVAEHDKLLAEHTKLLDEHEKRLAYAERRKGFIFERLTKGLIVDARDISRGIFATVVSPFNKDVRDAINKPSK